MDPAQYNTGINYFNIDYSQQERNQVLFLCHSACQAGNLEFMKSLLIQDPTLLKYCDKKGQTLMHVAVAFGHLEIMEWLYKENPSLINILDSKGFTPLHTAAFYNRLPILENFYNNLESNEENLITCINHLGIVLNIPRENNLLPACIYSNIGRIYGNLGNNKNAIEYHKKALEIRRWVLRDHFDTAESHLDLGDLYFNNKNNQLALFHYNEAYKFFLKESQTKPNELEHLVSICLNIALIYENLGYIHQTEIWNLKAIEIRGKIIGLDSIDMVEDYENIAGFYKSINRDDQALNYYNKAELIKFEHAALPEFVSKFVPPK